MAVNFDKPLQWKKDIDSSVDLYNDWFVTFAPKAFREQRNIAIKVVAESFITCDNFKVLTSALIKKNPSVLPILRMGCCPPIARERLAGLSYVPKTFVDSLDKRQTIPKRITSTACETHLTKIADKLNKLLDPDIFVWKEQGTEPQEKDKERALTIIADRLCGANADPIIRNAQEKRQLEKIQIWLEAKGYAKAPDGTAHDELKPGQFAFRINFPVALSEVAQEEEDEETLPSEIADKTPKDEPIQVNIPVDVAVMPKNSLADGKQLPLLIEAKSAGDFTNVNKRRKEEAKKIQQLKTTYGEKVQFILFLCGYFNQGYLGYSASDGIDWVWEHRIEDLAQFNL